MTPSAAEDPATGSGASPLPPAFEAAHRHSAYFRRTLAALGTRHPRMAALLPAMVAAPLVPEAVERCWQDVVAASPPGSVATDPSRALRQARQLLMLAIIARDVGGEARLEEVCHAISAWGELSVQIALRHIAAELAATHGVPLDASERPQDLLVVGMGKLGGNELNVSSDIDVIYVFREDGETAGGPGGTRRIASSEFFHRLARRLSGMLSDITEDGFVFRVDTRLRPNGDSGPLVASFPMLEQYFYQQGREWERFAWLKGRVIADSGLAGDEARRRDEATLEEAIAPFVFRRYLDFAAIESLRDLHALIRSEVDRRESRSETRQDGGCDVKLGRGGIREVEFCAQLLQVVRGGRDPTLRDRRTLHTLEVLGQRRLIDPQAARRLIDAYHLLRRIEHALQYQEDAQTHWLPGDPEVRARIAAMLGMAPDEFEARLAAARDQVQAEFDALLSDPGGQHGGNGAPPANGATGTRDNGTAPPAPLDAALQARIDALHEGRRYRMAKPETQRRIDQLIEQALRERPDLPGTREEAWLGRLLELLETIAGRPAYLALLVQFPGAFRRLLSMIARAKWAAEYLTRHPVVLDELLDGQILEAPTLAPWERDLRLSIGATTRQGEPDIERRMDILREAHHAQLFRLLAQDLEERLTVERLSDHLSELADRIVAIALDCAWQQVRQPHRETPRFCVVAYGRLGGKELGYASDLDLVFLYDDDDERAQPVYAQLAQRLSMWLSTRTAAGHLFEIDLRLRPNGEAGLPVSSLSAFESYQRQSAWVWEHQALTRARHAAGDPAIGARFEALRRDILATRREPGPLQAEVRAMRRRMLDGHPNRSELFDLKHDPGGMVDIEFLVQYLVLAHAADHPPLLDNAGNIALLNRAAAAGLFDATVAEAVAQAYRDYRRLQHSLRLNDARYARVEPATVASQRDAVTSLWNAVLGPY